MSDDAPPPVTPHSKYALDNSAAFYDFIILKYDPTTRNFFFVLRMYFWHNISEIVLYSLTTFSLKTSAMKLMRSRYEAINNPDDQSNANKTTYLKKWWVLPILVTFVVSCGVLAWKIPIASFSRLKSNSLTAFTCGPTFARIVGRGWCEVGSGANFSRPGVDYSSWRA